MQPGSDSAHLEAADPTSPIVEPTVSRLQPAVTQPAGSARLDSRSRDGQLLAEAVRLRRPGLSRRRRLHGSGQLGHRPRRRRALRLHAPERRHDLEPHGDPAPGPGGAPRHRQRPRPGAGLPRQLLAAGHDRASGSSARSPSRPATSPRCSARRSPCNLLFGIPLLAGVCLTALDVLLVLYLQQHRLPLRRGDRRPAHSRHRRRFAFELALSRPVAERRRRRFRPVDRDRPQPGHALHRDRHPRRDGHAAQPLPALVDRADAEVRRRRESRRECHPLRHHRLDRGALERAVHQRRHPDRRRGDLPRHRLRARRRHQRRVPAADAAPGHDARQHLFALALLFSGQNATHHRHAGRARS